MIGRAALLFLALVAGAARAGEAPAIELLKLDADAWRATYALSEPADELIFTRPKAGERARNWRACDDAFEIVFDGEKDALKRRDGAAFDEGCAIAPTAFLSERGYLTFAPFGDGGLLVYTGDFHACAGSCPTDETGDEGPWRISVRAPGERLISRNDAAADALAFDDRGDGRKVYVGDGAVVATGALYGVIDDRLPGDIKSALDALLPRLMAYFETRLGALDGKQNLFASYDVPDAREPDAREPGARKGAFIKGGTLPGQVFMHFAGAGVAARAAAPTFPGFLAWFFAHEAGHLYQRHRSARYEEGDSWIHEGGADALAYFALSDLNATSPDYLPQRLSKTLDACATALGDGPLFEARERDAFQAYYDCGVFLHLAAASSVARAGDADYFDLWLAFLADVRGGAPWNGETFARRVAAMGDAGTATFIERVAYERLKDPRTTLTEGLAASGFAWSDD